jgi:DinB superfamily
MIKQLEIIKKTRSFLLEQVKNLSSDQFNQKIEGFNNNIVWNMGHMIAAQQGICYKRAGLPTLISEDFWEKFRSGSKPEGIVSDDEITQIKQLLFITLDKFETDYNKQIFGNYTIWSTRYGFELTSIDDGIELLSFHDGLHSCTIIAMNRVLTK